MSIPFEFMIGEQVKNKEDLRTTEIKKKDCVENLVKSLEEFRTEAKGKILKIQEENKMYLERDANNLTSIRGVIC